MDLFIWGCQFLYILHREICLMNDNCMLFHCLKEWNAEKNIVWIFFSLFTTSNRIQKCRPRQVNSGGNQPDIVISSVQPPGRIKRSFVSCYKPLSNLCMADALAALQGHSWGWRAGVRTVWWSCWVRGAQGAPAQLVFGSPLPSLFLLMSWLWVSLNPKPHHHRGWRSAAVLQLSVMGGMVPRRLGCPLLEAIAANLTPEIGHSWTGAWPRASTCGGTSTAVAFSVFLLFGPHFSKTGSLPTPVGFWLSHIDTINSERKDN